MDNPKSLRDGAAQVMKFAAACKAKFSAGSPEFLKGVYLVSKTLRAAIDKPESYELGSRSGADQFQEERANIADDNFRFGFETFVKTAMFPRDNVSASTTRRFNKDCVPAL